MPTVSTTVQPYQITALQLIQSAMRVLNAIASGETLPPEEAADALITLNGMIDSWSVERLMVFTIQRQICIPTILKQVYTVGPGGDFNIPRPPAIPRIGVIILSNPYQPLELPMEMLTDVGWQGIPVKNIQSTVPEKVWDDQGFPLRNLSMWPIPSVQVQFALYTWTALQAFQDLATPYSFPPGYISAMKYNLALRLSMEFPGFPQASQTVAQMAQDSKARVQTINDMPILVDTRVDQALIGKGSYAFDWRTGEPVGGDR